MLRDAAKRMGPRYGSEGVQKVQRTRVLARFIGKAGEHHLRKLTVMIYEFDIKSGRKSQILLSVATAKQITAPPDHRIRNGQNNLHVN